MSRSLPHTKTFANKCGQNNLGPTTVSRRDAAAKVVDKDSIISKTGGVSTLAMGTADIMQSAFGSESLRSFCYHFAIMFKALFIFTTVDIGTHIARFIISDSLSKIKGSKLASHFLAAIALTLILVVFFKCALFK